MKLSKLTNFRLTSSFSFLLTLIGLLIFFTVGCGGGGGGEVADLGDSGTDIGSEGGTISNTDSSDSLYGLKLVIPPGALSTTETINIETTDETISLPAAVEATDTIISLTPDGLVFDDEVTITIPYDGVDVPVIVSYSESTGNYDILPIIDVDEQNKTVTVQTTHFSLFAKVITNISERFDTGFQVSEDSFSIENNSYLYPEFGQGVCLGFSLYSEWYYSNKKSTDGNLRERYGNCEKGLLVDSQSKDWTQFFDSTIGATYFWAGDIGDSIALGLINTALMITGKPQVLALRDGVSGDGHAVLVYAVSLTDSGYTYHIYDSNDNSEGKEIFYNKDDWSFEKYNNYDTFMYLGSSWSGFPTDYEMQEIYTEYNDCPIDDAGPPSIPTGLRVEAQASDWIYLEWNRSTDDIGVTGYRVYRDGAYLKSVTTPGTSDYELSASTEYCYSVSSYDFVGNESSQSTQECATTDASSACTDADGDGYAAEGGSCGQLDCNDINPDMHPGAIEICGDGIDQDCSGSDLSCHISIMLPDTGQTTSFTDTFGEDSDYSINPPSYTKLDASGSDLATSATDWAMVRDNVTGLIWEVKTDDSGIHDKDNTYTWQDGNDIFITQLNSENFGSYSDWRLPTAKELLRITNSEIANPCINTSYFPNTMPENYWSSTPNSDSSYRSFAWYVNFFSGISVGTRDGHQSSNYHVRAVRGPNSDESNYSYENNNIVIDTTTNLMWLRETYGTVKWEAAIDYCENYSTADYDDWRLPNIKELQSIVGFSNSLPSIDTSFFPGTQSSPYWSSTTLPHIPNCAWTLNFSFGHLWNYDKTYDDHNFYVRCVRTLN